jgi:hypothetical protein
VHHANSSLFASLDPVQEKPELEAQVDQGEEANPDPEPEQSKPWCITQLSLTFVLN